MYSTTLDCIFVTDDVIAYTKTILNEYKGRAPDLLPFMGFIRGLINKGKMKIFKKSYIDYRIRRYENRRRINYPSHSRDRKWIKIAIAVMGKYVLSTDSHLLNALPNQINNHLIETIEPSQYVELRCS